LAPAHDDRGCVRRLGTGGTSEIEVKYGGGGLPCEQMGDGKGLQTTWDARLTGGSGQRECTTGADAGVIGGRTR
jgi:hypothetical protein